MEGERCGDIRLPMDLGSSKGDDAACNKRSLQSTQKKTVTFTFEIRNPRPNPLDFADLALTGEPKSSCSYRKFIKSALNIAQQWLGLAVLVVNLIS
jgi:hypothetical protein